MDHRHLIELRSSAVPRWVGVTAELVLGARSQPERLKRVFERTSIPMLLVDNDRRYVDANKPARLAFRQTLADLRRLRIDDLTPPYFLPTLEHAWARLVETGCVASRYDIGSPVGTSMSVIYYALGNALPGLHSIAFAPADWPEGELLDEPEHADDAALRPLTRRETEVLELASEGRNAPMIAEELVLSAATVRTHFEHIYTKLGVRDRAGAVAKAMRLGVIR